MTAAAALPVGVNDDEGAVLTFIVPATRCNLECPFCFIKLRGEKSHEITLKPEDYVKFITDFSAKVPIAAVCIQGHEPLLEESFIYTKKISEISKKLGIPASVVTNGVFLSERLDDLVSLGLDRLAVSLDSHLPSVHDRLRGKSGAFDSTVHGLQAASQIEALRRAISVTSVLIPKNYHQIMGIPALLDKFNIREWTVNVLLKVIEGRLAEPVCDPVEIIPTLRAIKASADQYQVGVTFDDEFDNLKIKSEKNIDDSSRLRIKRLQNPSGVSRLLPNGKCSVGAKILQTIDADSPQWCPKEQNAVDFVRELAQ